ncbi:MAG: exonuclease domain-containing protein [Candidatus Nanopelagicales bacterium]
MSIPTQDQLPAKVAATRLWSGLRLLVVDTETTWSSSDKRQRVVSVAVVTCRAGTVRGHWQALVNPGIPITRSSTRIHGLTDAHVEGEPGFDAVAAQLLALLTERPGERLVVAAHRASFDVPVLRAELERAGHQMPDLAVLYTASRLPAVVGISPDGRGLAHLLAALGLQNAKPHDALADATATAEAAVALLGHAAAAGFDDLDALLAAAGTTQTTLTITYAGPGSADGDDAAPVTLPDHHVAGHAQILGRGTSQRTLDRWLRQIDECATLRCPYLADRITEATADPATLLTLLQAALDARITENDAPGAATVLLALAPLLADLPPVPGASGQRRAALAWHRRHAQPLRALGRCGKDDRCPACRAGDACGLDVWATALAPAALGGRTTQLARGFFETTGKEAGTGVYTGWASAGRGDLADATLELAAAIWRDAGQDSRAADVVRLGWQAGCRNPVIADAHAVALAAGGREPDLRAALDVCRTALATRDGSTADGWAELEARAAMLAGRLDRLRVRYTDQIDEDGNRIPARRHHPSTPRRTRSARFLRSGAELAPAAEEPA